MLVNANMDGFENLKKIIKWPKLEPSPSVDREDHAPTDAGVRLKIEKW